MKRALILSLTFAACAPLQPSMTSSSTEGPSMFPVFVVDEEPHVKRNGRSFARYRACAAVAVAPGLVATSSGALPPPSGDSSFVNAGSINVFDEDAKRDVVDVPYFEHATGLTLIRVRGALTPLQPAPTPSVGDEAVIAGFAFDPRGTRSFAGAMPLALRTRIVSTSAIDAAGGRMYAVETAASPGLCGAAVLDVQGRLIGIVHGGHGNRLYVVGADTIAKAVIEAGQ